MRQMPRSSGRNPFARRCTADGGTAEPGPHSSAVRRLTGNSGALAGMGLLSALAAALTGGLTAGTAGAQDAAPCSWGTSLKCAEITECVRWSTIGSYNPNAYWLRGPLLTCSEYHTRTLYFADLLPPERPPSGSIPSEPGAPPGGEF